MLWSYLELNIDRFNPFGPFLIAFLAFDELVEVVNQYEVITPCRHTMLI